MYIDQIGGNSVLRQAHGVGVMAEALGINRSFEEGDLTNFTETLGGYGRTNTFYPTGGYDGAECLFTRIFASGVAIGDNRTMWQRIVYDKVPCIPGQQVTGSIRVKAYAATGIVGASYTTQTFETNMLFYDASETVIQTTTLSSTMPTDTANYRQDTATVTAPASTAFVSLERYMLTTIHLTAEGGFFNLYIFTDDFSITSPGDGGGIIWF